MDNEEMSRLHIGGNVIRIGMVPSQGPVPSYFGIVLERGHVIYQLIPGNGEQAEILAMTKPGDTVQFSLAVSVETLTPNGPSVPVEFQNPTLKNELQFPSMGNLPVSMRRNYT
ncbi:hypothetical protein [Janthinobacterium sp. J1-1]|uniref:hypothetical protein n=1 Tax=Janthinobacterium sp. J1-1 TaxID=3065910 RepID=UPI002810EE3C|nr:hypothetical protein [Janthinobacterium sp. J1-1]